MGVGGGGSSAQGWHVLTVTLCMIGAGLLRLVEPVSTCLGADTQDAMCQSSWVFWQVRIRVSHSVVSDSFWPHGLWPTRLLCPWDSPGKNTRVGCHAHLQGIFPTWDQTRFPALRVDPLPSEPQNTYINIISVDVVWVVVSFYGLQPHPGMIICRRKRTRKQQLTNAACGSVQRCRTRACYREGIHILPL